ncbi:MAG TPA: condensation domain-containing protein, partial [Longimicrobium sp.]|nr:condensation domain-containing protein [Longimicrobium sp.]
MSALVEGAVALPASLGQQRLWFLDQVEPGTGRYNMGIALRIPHELDLDALRRALDELAARHEPLRTVFADVNGEAAQVIHPPAPVDLPTRDLAALPEPERAAEARRGLEYEAQRPYDLARGPLFRPHLVRLGASDHVLALNLHHAAADEHALNVLVRETEALYTAFAAGLPSPLGEPPVQYADFALWQREMLEDGEMDRQLAWWTERMRGTSGVLDLPTDRTRPAQPAWRGASHSFHLPDGVRAPLAELARREGATMFMVLLALTQLLLARMSGDEDVVVGTPVGGRTPETEGTVGFFVNTLPLRTDVGGNPSFRELVRRARDTAVGALAHPDLPLERLVEALPLERDPSRFPLFQVMFVFGPDAPPADGAAGWTRVPVELHTARYDLTLVMRDSGHGLRGVIDYATDLFDESTVARIGGRMRALAAAVAARPDAPAWDAPLLPEDEDRRIHSWSGADAGPRADAALLIFREKRRVPRRGIGARGDGGGERAHPPADPGDGGLVEKVRGVV